MFFLNKFLKKNNHKDYGIQTDDFTKFNEVKNLIEEEIKHFIKSHNGKIKLIAVRENIVYIELRGSCAGCPAIEITLNGFIQKKLKDHFPWCEKVKKVN